MRFTPLNRTAGKIFGFVEKVIEVSGLQAVVLVALANRSLLFCRKVGLAFLIWYELHVFK